MEKDLLVGLVSGRRGQGHRCLGRFNNIEIGIHNRGSSSDSRLNKVKKVDATGHGCSARLSDTCKEKLMMSTGSVMSSYVCRKVPVGRNTREIEDEIVVNVLHGRCDEASLYVVCPDSARSCHRFTEVDVNGRSRCRLNPLQLT